MEKKSRIRYISVELWAGATKNSRPRSNAMKVEYFFQQYSGPITSPMVERVYA